MSNLLEILVDWEEPWLLDLECAGIPLWPSIRYELFWAVLSQNLSFQAELNQTPLWPKWRLALESLKCYPFVTKQKDILFLSEDSVSIATNEGTWYNRLHDAFADCYPTQSSMILNPYRNYIHSPRYFNTYIPHTSLTLPAKILGLKNKVDSSAIQSFIQKLRKSFPIAVSEQTWDQLESSLIRSQKEYPTLLRVYKNYLKRISPRVLFVNCAHYGFLAPLIVAARGLGIRTAEIQHGLWGTGHIAYQHNSRLCSEKKYCAIFPDDLLTYGDFWNTQAVVPATKISLGNPNLSAPKESFSLSSKKKYRLLILSQWTITQPVLDFAFDLAQKCGDQLEIILRLHPSESLSAEQSAQVESLANLSLDQKQPLMTSVQKADLILGSSSTAIFEAAATGRPVFILDQADSKLNTPMYFGNWVKSPTEFLEKLKAVDHLKIHSYEEFWQENWKENYRAYIDRFLNGEKQ